MLAMTQNIGNLSHSFQARDTMEKDNPKGNVNGDI
jgi:hypothetical protein